MEMLNYREQTETPWITFTEDVATPNNLIISPSNYHNLKKLAYSRLESFLNLISSKNQCRNTILLNYFNVEVKEDCGICDICIGKKKKEFGQKKYEQIKESILTLSESGISYAKIPDQFSVNQKPDAIKLLKFLIDEGILK
jgi:ATP-dependent DNA helicase RecQ